MQRREDGKILVCFAVKEEAGPFRKRLQSNSEIEVLITGMGERNAWRAIDAALLNRKPALVLTCGFAGGARPGLKRGMVIYELDGAMEADLKAAGAVKGTFCCASKVASTADKQVLWKAGADAVEMESAAIRCKCLEVGIPSATVRVILDEAEEELPLDFNRLMTADQKLSYWQLAMALAKAPGKIPALMRLQRQSRDAAEKLAEVLEKLLLDRKI